MNLLLEGDDLEALLIRARHEGGPFARIVRAEKVRHGGVLGFFAKEGFEVAVEVPGSGLDDEEELARPSRRVLPRREEALDALDEDDGSIEKAAALAMARQAAFEAAMASDERAPIQDDVRSRQTPRRGPSFDPYGQSEVRETLDLAKILNAGGYSKERPAFEPAAAEAEPREARIAVQAEEIRAKRAARAAKAARSAKARSAKARSAQARAARQRAAQAAAFEAAVEVAVEEPIEDAGTEDAGAVAEAVVEVTEDEIVRETVDVETVSAGASSIDIDLPDPPVDLTNLPDGPDNVPNSGLSDQAELDFSRLRPAWARSRAPRALPSGRRKARRAGVSGALLTEARPGLRVQMAAQPPSGGQSAEVEDPKPLNTGAVSSDPSTVRDIPKLLPLPPKARSGGAGAGAADGSADVPAPSPAPVSETIPGAPDPVEAELIAKWADPLGPSASALAPPSAAAPAAAPAAATAAEAPVDDADVVAQWAIAPGDGEKNWGAPLGVDPSVTHAAGAPEAPVASAALSMPSTSTEPDVSLGVGDSLTAPTGGAAPASSDVPAVRTELGTELGASAARAGLDVEANASAVQSAQGAAAEVGTPAVRTESDLVTEPGASSRRAEAVVEPGVSAPEPGVSAGGAGLVTATEPGVSAVEAALVAATEPEASAVGSGSVTATEPGASAVGIEPVSAKEHGVSAVGTGPVTATGSGVSAVGTESATATAPDAFAGETGPVIAAETRVAAVAESGHTETVSARQSGAFLAADSSTAPTDPMALTTTASPTEVAPFAASTGSAALSMPPAPAESQPLAVPTASDVSTAQAGPDAFSKPGASADSGAPSWSASSADAEAVIESAASTGSDASTSVTTPAEADSPALPTWAGASTEPDASTDPVGPTWSISSDAPTTPAESGAASVAGAGETPGSDALTAPSWSTSPSAPTTPAWTTTPAQPASQPDVPQLAAPTPVVLPTPRAHPVPTPQLQASAPETVPIQIPSTPSPAQTAQTAEAAWAPSLPGTGDPSITSPWAVNSATPTTPAVEAAPQQQWAAPSIGTDTAPAAPRAPQPSLAEMPATAPRATTVLPKGKGKARRSKKNVPEPRTTEPVVTTSAGSPVSDVPMPVPIPPQTTSTENAAPTTTTASETVASDDSGRHRPRRDRSHARHTGPGTNPKLGTPGAATPPAPLSAGRVEAATADEGGFKLFGMRLGGKKKAKDETVAPVTPLKAAPEQAPATPRMEASTEAAIEEPPPSHIAAARASTAAGAGELAAAQAIMAATESGRGDTATATVTQDPTTQAGGEEMDAQPIVPSQPGAPASESTFTPVNPDEADQDVTASWAAGPTHIGSDYPAPVAPPPAPGEGAGQAWASPEEAMAAWAEPVAVESPVAPEEPADSHDSPGSGNAPTVGGPVPASSTAASEALVTPIIPEAPITPDPPIDPLTAPLADLLTDPLTGPWTPDPDSPDWAAPLSWPPGPEAAADPETPKESSLTEHPVPTPDPYPGLYLGETTEPGNEPEQTPEHPVDLEQVRAGIQAGLEDAEKIAASLTLAADKLALTGLGVPPEWTTNLRSGDRFMAVVQMLGDLPEPTIPDDVQVIAVVGAADVVGLEAARTALDLPHEGGPRPVVTIPVEVGPGRLDALDLGAATRPVVVSIPVAGDRAADAEMVREVLQHVRAEAVIAVLDGTRSLDENRRWVADLGQVDAVALDGALDSGEPAAVLQLGLPVVRLDGIGVDRVGWAAVLCTQLAVGGAAS